jgi:TonB family protein
VSNQAYEEDSMFETSQVRAEVQAASGRATVLSISIAVHTFVVLGAVGASIASVDFPKQYPDQVRMVEFVRAVPLPPPSQGRPRTEPARRPSAPVQPRTQTAPVQPNVIPETTIPAQGVPGNTASSDLPAGDQEATGDPNGDPNGVPGATGDTPLADPIQAAPYVVGEANGVSAPQVLTRVDPIYPQMAVRSKLSGLVVVQCTIDREGRVRDVSVVRSTFAAFEQSAVDAVRRWKFSPGMLRGKPVDTIFHLTVTFRISNPT